MTKPTCASCTWWAGESRLDGIVLRFEAGECRRRAPQGTGQAYWPWTKVEDFCGDHVQRMSAEAMRMVP